MMKRLQIPAVAVLVGLTILSCSSHQGQDATPKTTAKADNQAVSKKLQTAPPPEAGKPVLKPLSKSDLDITLGKIQTDKSKKLTIDSAKVRAVETSGKARESELTFQYLGPIKDVAPLHSGLVVRQAGLKFRALNGCNLVYVMWRFEPKSEILVLVKSNPGMTIHKQCEAGGYSTMKPETYLAPPTIKVGEEHKLNGKLDGTKLVVELDGKVVWSGTIDQAALAFDGPAGLRTDNVKLSFTFSVLKP